MKGKKILSCQRNFMLRQIQYEAEVNFITTKTDIVETKVEKNARMLRHKNLCCDIIKN